MTRFRWIPAMAILFLLTFMPTLAQGQELTMMWEFTPKAGAANDFEAAVKSHMELRASHGDPWQWSFSLVVVGENVGTYYALSSGHTWADFDSYDSFEATETLNAHWESNVVPLMEEVKSSIFTSNAELSRLPDNPEAYTLFNVSNFYLKPDQQPAFAEAIGKYLEVIAEHDLPFYWQTSTNVAGGDGPLMGIVGMAENWAGFADPDPSVETLLVEKYGEEGAMELFKQFAGAYHYYKNFVVVTRPDLSSPGM